ncbi:acid protease [Rhizophagus clarus]|uniref:Acid protease n=1 Tax=Rhizophagus clarus TaxID=94130 RepID=A0A8H3L6N1_9GLOM|nr:acid protease [Rhizophagus clarus]
MHALHIFTLAIAVFLFVDALPYERPKVHTIPLKMKPITRRRAYNVSRRATEQITLDQDQPDLSYFGEVTFGTGEPQELYMLFDTGSADLFVIGDECISPACSRKNKYNSYLDDSYKRIERSFQVNYVSGAFVKGTCATTDIEIGSISVETQDFGLVDTVSDDFADYTFALDQPQFSFMLGRDADNTPSELTIGGSNPARYDANSLTWTNLANNNKGLWKIPLDDCFVGGQPLGFQDRIGSIDTGSASIIMPIADANALYNKVPKSVAVGKGFYLIPCSTNIEIGLRFSGMTWNMDYRDFILKQGNDCYGSIQGIDTGSDAWIIGIPFLKNVYSIFDQDHWKRMRSDGGSSHDNDSEEEMPDDSDDDGYNEYS